jgi:hypothetical protein
MKKIFALLMIFSAIVSFSSCDKTTDVTTLLGKMTATIDGTAWSVSATDVTNGIGGVAAITAENKFMITGTSTNGKTIIIVINGNEVNKEYDLTPLAGAIGAATVYRNSPDAADAETYYSTLGSVTITTKTDTRISGIFHFTAAKSVTDVVQIVGGTFENVLYTSSSSLTGSK